MPINLGALPRFLRIQSILPSSRKTGSHLVGNRRGAECERRDTDFFFARRLVSALASGGLARFDSQTHKWTRLGAFKEQPEVVTGSTERRATPARRFDAVVNDLACGERMFCRDEEDYFFTTDNGKAWSALFSALLTCR